MENIDYNKPKISWVTGKPLDNIKVVAEEWLLKTSIHSCSITKCKWLF